MSDFSIGFEDYDDDSIFDSENTDVKDKESYKSDNLSKFIKYFFCFLLFCVLVEFSFYKFIRPSMAFPKVNVSGNHAFSANEIVSLLRTMDTHNWYDFDVNAAVSILASESGIDSVVVKKTFPNKIYIHVVERNPVAMTFLNQNGRSIAVHVDKNGVLFPEHSLNSPDLNFVPIISGLPIEHMTTGMRIPLKYRPLIDQIADIQSMSQKYFAAISEICVIPKEYGNYELILIPAGSKIKVLTDRTLNEDALKYMMVALDVVNSVEPDVSVIDLRYGSVSYRKR